MSGYGPTDDVEATKEGRAFLQSRVASFGFVSGIAVLSFLIYRIGNAVSIGKPASVFEPDMLAHLGGSILLIGT